MMAASPMPTAIAAPEADARLLELVAFAACVVPTPAVARGGVSEVEFTLAGERLTGVLTAARALAAAGPAAAALAPAEPAAAAAADQWMTWARSELGTGLSLLDSQLAKLEAWLGPRTLLAGNGAAGPTLADLVVYARVAPAAAALPEAQHGHFASLLRWYAHVGAVADPGALFPRARVEKPRLRAPPPPPPAAPKDKAADKAAPAAAVAAAAVAAAAAAPAAAAAAAAAEPAAAGGSKKDKKKAEKAAAKAAGGSGGAPATPAASSEPAAAAGPAPAAAAEPTIACLDLRVGLITACAPHPDADALYVEEIDLGEESGPRTIVSGLRKFVPLDQMLGRRVVVVCNLKPAKMRGVTSAGMVLCASDAEHTAVDPVAPPPGAAPGARVRVEGFAGAPEAVLNPKRKQFEKVAPELVTDAGARGVWWLGGWACLHARISMPIYYALRRAVLRLGVFVARARRTRAARPGMPPIFMLVLMVSGPVGIAKLTKICSEANSKRRAARVRDASHTALLLLSFLLPPYSSLNPTGLSHPPTRAPLPPSPRPAQRAYARTAAGPSPSTAPRSPRRCPTRSSSEGAPCN
jgi:aminoacyl tRNA synthase complex-interacting multifunctional protein 1